MFFLATITIGYVNNDLVLVIIFNLLQDLMNLDLI